MMLLMVCMILPGDALHEMAEKYAAVDSVFVKASAEVSIFESDDGKERVLNRAAIYEFWGRGDLYRISVVSDPDLGLVDDMDVAFDGDIYQLFLPNESLMSVQNGDALQAATAIQNPFFMPVQFLTVEDDDCRACPTKLSFFREADYVSQKIQGAHQKKKPSSDDRVYVVPGGIFDKVPFEYHVVFSHSSMYPSSIERISGSSVLRISFADYEQVSHDFFFPREIDMVVYENVKVESGEVVPIKAVQISYSIDEIAVGADLQKQDFQINSDLARLVWDSDQNVFLKRD